MPPNSVTIASASHTEIALHAPEVALVIVAPFVHEAVHAAGVGWMAQVAPTSLNVTGRTDGARAVLEREHEARAPLVRRANRLGDEQREDERRAIALWMMNRCVARDPLLWEHPQQGHLPRTLRDAVDEARRLSPAARSTFTWMRIRELARCIFADPARIGRDEDNDRLTDEEPISGAGSVRDKMLGHLLCLAGWMAMDARRLDRVVVGHIGLRDPLLASHVLQVLRNARWSPSRNTLSLTGTCPHPAIDVALRDGVSLAAAVLDRIRQSALEARARLDALGALPVRLDAEGVGPERDPDGHGAYQPNHIRFVLAHVEVKELLMGKHLYGDPALAIRELYQNALDACRYREKRREYLLRMGGAQVESWSGLIQFRQGEEDGRHYLECIDNGVGMDLATLEGCFAKAGRRFPEMPEYLEEETQWLRVPGLEPLYPNSQFGIGVFSHFMLADEIEVETCRFNRRGDPEPIISASVSGSGGLFRIRVGTPSTKAGTRVRLYLDRDAKVSCLKVLKELLYIADYTTAVEEHGRTGTWEAHVLRLPSSHRSLPLEADLWATDGDGILLADGLLTGDDRIADGFHLVIPHVIVNLRGVRKPRLTVDRSSVVEWDRAWVRAAVLRQWQKLADWERMRLEMLWWFDATLPDLAVKIVQQRDGHAEFATTLTKRGLVRLDQIGCFALDREILAWAVDDDWNQSDKSDEVDDLLTSHLDFVSGDEGIALLRQRVIRWDAVGANVHEEAVESLEEPGRRLVPKAWVPKAGDWFALHVSAGRPAGLITCALQLGETVVQVLDRLAILALPALQSSSIDRAALSTLEPSTSDVTFLSVDLDGAAPWIVGSATVLHALKAMEVLGESVERILARYERYRCLGVSPPDLTADQLIEALPEDPREWFVLTGKSSPSIRRVTASVKLPNVMQRAARAKLPLAIALRRIAMLGVTGPRVDFEPTADYVPAPNDHMELGIPFSNRLLLGEFLALLARGGPEAVGRQLDIARRAGLVPAECTDDVFTGLQVDMVDRRLLSRDGDGASPWRPRTFTASQVQGAAVRANVPIEEAQARLRRLAPLGVRIIDDGGQKPPDAP